MSERITLIADPDNYRVGCVLLQAVYGCPSDVLYELGFNTNTWDTAPTSTQQRITGTREEWKQFAKMCNEKHR